MLFYNHGKWSCLGAYHYHNTCFLHTTFKIKSDTLNNRFIFSGNKKKNPISCSGLENALRICAQYSNIMIHVLI